MNLPETPPEAEQQPEPTTPCPPPRKRPRLGAFHVTSGTVTDKTLHQWSQQEISLMDMPIWQHLTHVVVHALTVTPEGHVQVLPSIQPWLATLNALRVKYPHLKLMACFAPLAVVDVLQVVWDDHMDTFFETWTAVLTDLNADGTVLPLEHVHRVPPSFADHLPTFAFRAKTWLTMPNTPQRLLERWGRAVFEQCQDHVQFMVMPCYNYLEYDRVDTERGLVGFLKASMEAAYLPYQQCLKDAPFIFTPKLLMGLDTCGLVYHQVDPETMRAQYVHALPYHEISRLRKVGVKHGQRLYRYKEMVDPVAQASALYLPHTREWITFDTYRIRNTKLNGLVKSKMRGVMLGDLAHDLPVLHPDSMARMMYQKCEPRGLDVRPNACHPPLDLNQ